MWPPKDGSPFMPANGTEGEVFYEMHCAHCTREAAFREFGDPADGCRIMSNSMAGEKPKEWVYHKGSPTCLAFTDKPLPEPRCPLTMEMF